MRIGGISLSHGAEGKLLAYVRLVDDDGASLLEVYEVKDGETPEGFHRRIVEQAGVQTRRFEDFLDYFEERYGNR